MCVWIPSVFKAQFSMFIDSSIEKKTFNNSLNSYNYYRLYYKLDTNISIQK